MISQLLVEIVEVSGYAPALELCRAFGGRSITVPRELADVHPLVLTMGRAPALALAKRFGGEALSVPAERTALMDLRNARIVADYNAGATVMGLAQDYGLTRKRVTEILDEAGVKRRSLARLEA